jgi:hypothetical protein
MRAIGIFRDAGLNLIKHCRSQRLVVSPADQSSPSGDDRYVFQRCEARRQTHAGVTGSNTDLALTKAPLGLSPNNASNAGRSFPLGATVLPDGVNFSVFSRRATRVELLLFDHADAVHPTRVIELDAHTHRTYHYWHAFVRGIGPGQVYAYRVAGPFDPDQGLRMDPGKVLLDPYGRAVVLPDGYSRRMASQYGEDDVIAMKKCRGRPRPLRLGGGCSIAAVFRHDRDLRDACRRVYPPSELGGRCRAARNLCGDDRENPVPDGSRNYCG